MAKKRSKKSVWKTVGIVLGVTVAGVVGYILYQRSKQPGLSTL